MHRVGARTGKRRRREQACAAGQDPEEDHGGDMPFALPGIAHLSLSLLPFVSIEV